MASKLKKKWIIVLAAAVILIVALYYLWQNGWSIPYGTRYDYQAVFLSNGQVYFGRASNINANYLNLRDVYYLQVQQVLQPVQGQKEPRQTQSISLAKLGISELHKPKDEMKVNRDHVLFIEDLDPDSQVVQAIMRFKEEQKQAAEESN